jgi:hypothetical protein
MEFGKIGLSSPFSFTLREKLLLWGIQDNQVNQVQKVFFLDSGFWFLRRFPFAFLTSPCYHVANVVPSPDINHEKPH